MGAHILVALVSARHCSEHFLQTNSLNPPNLDRQATFHHFSNEETETHTKVVICLRPHSRART